MDMSMALDELSSELSTMEKKRQEQLAVECQQVAELVATTSDPKAPLPSQGPASLAFQESIFKSVDAKDAKLSGKKALVSRKEKNRKARQAKKAEDHQDKVSVRKGQVMKKERTKHRVKNMY